MPKRQTGKLLSTYSATDSGEVVRLKKQAEAYLDLDKEWIKESIRLMPEKPLVLDIGCAQGHLAESRFRGNPRISKVVGIDINRQALLQAEERLPKPWSFYHISIEEKDIELLLKDLLADENNPGQPVIAYISFVLMHLNNPVRALRALRYALPSGSVIIVHTTDDSFIQVDPEFRDRLKSILTPSAPDPTGGKRDNGHNLASQLDDAGLLYSQILINQQNTDDMTQQERLDLFAVSYAWRADGLANLIKEGRANVLQQEEYLELKKSLARLKQGLVDGSLSLKQTVTVSALARVP